MGKVGTIYCCEICGKIYEAVEIDREAQPMLWFFANIGSPEPFTLLITQGDSCPHDRKFIKKIGEL